MGPHRSQHYLTSPRCNKTYVNELDVRKVKAGQPVEIGLDAYRREKLKGVVTKVANVGNSVPILIRVYFEVAVEISESTDPALRPSMTTNNRIIYQSRGGMQCMCRWSHCIAGVIPSRMSLKKTVECGEAGGCRSEDQLERYPLYLPAFRWTTKFYLSIPPGLEGQTVNLLQVNGKRKKKPEETVAKGHYGDITIHHQNSSLC